MQAQTTGNNSQYPMNSNGANAVFLSSKMKPIQEKHQPNNKED
jgi:hypothetical protein